MAIFHCSIKVIGRGSGKSLARGGRSAVGAAAYRSGTLFINEYDGMVHDYTKKRGVLYSEIMLPENAPSSFSDRSTLWNSLELYETRGNAQLVREIEAALPIELSFEEHKKIVQDYLKPFVKAGMVADFSMHSPDRENPNPHVHIMLTMRPLDAQGRWSEKSRLEYELDEEGNRIKLSNGKWKTRKVFLTDWDDKGNCTKWRKEWADVVNHHLESNGLTIRIDHRSYEDQGIDLIPTIHLGTAATAMERRGIQTERGNINVLYLLHIRQLVC